MKASHAWWAALVIAVGGCTQILELDQPYRPNDIIGGGGGAGGGTGGGPSGPPCMTVADCPVVTNATCATVACVDSICVTSFAPSGTTCESGATCNGTGICGECNLPDDCTMLPVDDECQSRLCDKHVCKPKFAPKDSKLMMQTMGDCTDAVCDGMGQVTTKANNGDVPNDNNACTKDECSGGVPAHPFEAQGKSCGVDLFCDGSGKCVGCLIADDCPGMDDFCKTRACVADVCDPAFTTGGTIVPTGQTDGDCKIIQCDGQGNFVPVADNTDLPNDGNPCTKNLCVAGTVSHPLEPQGTSCGTNSACNSAGLCQKINGATCAAGAECVSGNCIENRCCDTTCTQNCKACNVPGLEGTCSTVPPGVSDNTCPAPSSCDGSNGAGACVSKSPNGSACATSADCGSNFCVDGICCSTACTDTCKACNIAGNLGKCTNLPSGVDDPGNCTGTNSCNGAGVCFKDIGATCMANADCLNNICVDGFCCNTLCTGLCQACSVTLKGSGSNGICGSIAASTDPSNECAAQGAMTCGTNGFCNGAGACALYASNTICNAQSCAGTTQTNTDTCNGMGVCVDGGTTNCAPYTCGASACKTSCASDADCLSTHFCSGVSCVAKLANGTTCTTNNQCSAGNCVDGVCCATACAGTCQACNVAGFVGTCTNVPVNQPDSPGCVMTMACNGMGMCLLAAGQTCMANTDCASNNCLGSICQ